MQETMLQVQEAIVQTAKILLEIQKVQEVMLEIVLKIMQEIMHVLLLEIQVDNIKKENDYIFLFILL